MVRVSGRVDCGRAGVIVAVRVLGALALAAFLASCASDMPRDVQLPPHVTYRCEGGRTLEVDFAPSGEVATLNLGGKAYRLPKVPGATQAKFSDGSTTLWLDGQNALVESRVAMAGRNCRSEQELPERARSDRPLFGSDPWWR
jgi:membrane-bound inhibitor of C-type lysozyme